MATRRPPLSNRIRLGFVARGFRIASLGALTGAGSTVLPPTVPCARVCGLECGGAYFQLLRGIVVLAKHENSAQRVQAYEPGHRSVVAGL
jgi:hypothetical protein